MLREIQNSLISSQIMIPFPDTFVVLKLVSESQKERKPSTILASGFVLCLNIPLRRVASSSVPKRTSQQIQNGKA
jgi:hypothetical protein